MKIYHLCLAIFLGLVFVGCSSSTVVSPATLTPVSAGQVNVPQEDLDAIRQTALDYVEGWYYADAERMARSLHPDFIKRTLRDNQLVTIGAEEMVKYTQEGAGKAYQGEKKFFVTILDVYKEIASVKAESPEYIDYIQVGKVDGKWLIINVLWTVKSSK